MITIVRNTVQLKESEAKGEIKSVKTADGQVLKYGVITLPSFYMDFDAAMKGKKDYKSSTSDVLKILKNFEKEKIQGLILDMRANGGGSLYEAIRLTGLFITQGPVVQVKNTFGNIRINRDTDSNIQYDGPMIVLVNKLSASATEIFAGAIQDYQRGIVIGDNQTHGKGTVQTIISLDKYSIFFGVKPPAGSLKLTNAKFYRVNGASTQRKGVTPDIVFPSFTDAMKMGEDNLEHALPWDTIKPAKHDTYIENISTIIDQLKTRSSSRLEQNDKFVNLKKEIATFKRIRDRKEVSLNEKKRWEEYLKEKELQKQQTKLMRLDDRTEDGKDPKDKKKQK